ncbi:hypothetical protein SAMN05421640_2481 [Ekhidna lutea]|uniref:Uncharacterized protein n=1 Tax=Ekhidna lutea TaxID=447679 RepID=A0A239K912_EKHLU|nr:hypothetical protein [Ekhidna lutea]SNT14113.1 hypothetical protein SAMN05421640_2481 [Ekhidna lutea]
MHKLKSYIKSYRNRFYILSLILLLISIVAFKIAIKPSIAGYTIYNNLNRNISEAGSITDISQLEELSQFYNDFIYPGSQVSFQNDLINKTAKITSRNGSRLVSFSVVDEVQHEAWLEKNYKIRLSGTYTDMLKTVDELQDQIEGGLLKNLKFEMILDRHTRRNTLFCEVYVQSISQLLN